MIRHWTCAVAVAAAGCALPDRPPAAPPEFTALPAVGAIGETLPVDSPMDAADDAAIWVHPLDPLMSVVIGTDKQRGLLVYDLEGRLLQSLPDGRMNNVDLRDGFEIGGRSMTLVAASNRSDRTIALYLLEPDSRRLRRIGAPVPTGFRDPYGLCMYAEPGGDQFIFVSNAGDGRFRQWRVRAGGETVIAERVREFRVGSQAEGCVADDDAGTLYVAEEGGGFWKYRAAPDGGGRRREIDRVGGPSGLKADLEGVSIWSGHDGRGFIVLSNQGTSSYAVYRREGEHAFVGLFRIVDDDARGIDGVSGTDGLAVVSQPLGARYPDGLLVVQDGSNEPAGEFQNFKFVSWRDVMVALDIR